MAVHIITINKRKYFGLILNKKCEPTQASIVYTTTISAPASQTTWPEAINAMSEAILVEKFSDFAMAIGEITP
ncbi:MAG: hypothetical protein ACI9Y1_000346 [Lentisphaeria bacterium]|jgi:hypothetical protein